MTDPELWKPLTLHVGIGAFKDYVFKEHGFDFQEYT